MPSSARSSRSKGGSSKSAKRKAQGDETSTAPKKARHDKKAAAPAPSTPASSSQIPHAVRTDEEDAITYISAQRATSLQSARLPGTSRTSKTPESSILLPEEQSKETQNELERQARKRGAEMEATILMVALASRTYACRVSCRYPPDDVDPVLAATRFPVDCPFCGVTHNHIFERCEKMREWTCALQLWQNDAATAVYKGRRAIREGTVPTDFKDSALQVFDPLQKPQYNYDLPVGWIVQHLGRCQEKDHFLRAKTQELLFHFAYGPHPKDPEPTVETDEQLVARLAKYLEEADAELAEKDELVAEQSRLRARLNELLNEYASGTELAQPASTPESDEQLVGRLREQLDRADQELVEKDNLEAKYGRMRTEVNALLSEFADGPKPTEPASEGDDQLLGRLAKYIEQADQEWANKEKLEVELERANARIAELEHNYRLAHEDNDRLEKYNLTIVEKFNQVKEDLNAQKEIADSFRTEHERAVTLFDRRCYEYEVLSKEHDKLRHMYDLLELCCWRHGLVEHSEKSTTIKPWTSVTSEEQASPTVSANGAANVAPKISETSEPE